jgi:hypothetical protein
VGCGPGQDAGLGLGEGPAGCLFDLVVLAAQGRVIRRKHQDAASGAKRPPLATVRIMPSAGTRSVRVPKLTSVTQLPAQPL